MGITPESLQYVLGIHPSQLAAEQAFTNATQGDTSGYNPITQQDEDDPDRRQKAEREQQSNPLGMPSARPEDAAFKQASEGDSSEYPHAYTDDGKPAKITSATYPGAGTTLGMESAKAPDSGTSSAPATPSPSVSRPSSYNPLTDPIRSEISDDQAREAKDRAEAQRLQTTGSGVEQFQHKHHILGPIVRGLTIAGSVLAPGVAAQIPGTDLHHNVLQNEANARVKQDEADQTAHFNMFDRIEANRIRDEREGQANQKFVAGTEKEDQNSPTGYVAQTVGGEWKPYTPPSSYKQTKGEGFDDVQRQREKEADRLHLTGEKRELYIANGKLPEPGAHEHPQSAEQEHYEDVKEAFKAQYGHYPQSSEDFDTFNRMLKGEKGGGKSYTKDRETFESHWARRLGPGSAVERKYDAQRNAVLKSYGADKDPSAYKDNKEDIEAKFKQIEADREAEKAALQQEKDDEAEQYGIYNQRGPQASQPQTAQPAAGESGIEKPKFDVRSGQPIQQKPSPAAAGKLTPITDKQMQTPGGHTVKIGDKNPRTGQIVKGFARNSKGEVVATY